MSNPSHTSVVSLVLIVLVVIAAVVFGGPLLGQESSTPILTAAQKSPNAGAPAHMSKSAQLATATLSSPAAPGSAAANSTSELPKPIVSTVHVNAYPEDLSAGIDLAQHVTQRDVLSSAGTFGDFTRYLQTLPAVAWNSDLTNEMIVRGGHPSENLFVVDGFEVPNINHLAFAGTTGGFASMMDTSVVGSVDMKNDGYTPRYSSRLSALIDIRTLNDFGGRSAHAEAGLSGLGGFYAQPYPHNWNVMISAHRSVLNWFTNNIGMDGVPIYTNGLARADWKSSSGDQVSFLTLAGGDSLTVIPCAWNELETFVNDTYYNGSRMVQGVRWQHPHAANALSVVSASYTLENRSILQMQQNAGYAYFNRKHAAGRCAATSVTKVYGEEGQESVGALRYEFDHSNHGWSLSGGSGIELVGSNYDVAQPQGQQSPFNVNPSWTDSDSFTRKIWTGSTGTFVETSYRSDMGWTALAGVRYETSALTGSHNLNPRASVSFRLGSHQALSLEANGASQEPPAIDVLSYAQNHRLRPITVRQYSAALDVWHSGTVTAQLQAFSKRYSHEPVSSEYPSLMTANMVDLLGQQIVWLPLQSGGYGKSEGISTLVKAHWNPWIEVIASANYGHVRYAAKDGILRPGNFDLRFIGNGLLDIHISKHISLFGRDTYTSGRPYTPFDMVHSHQQARGIYDLRRINAERASAYNRVDMELAYTAFPKHKRLVIHAGIDNAFDRQNFLGYFWLTRLPPGSGGRSAFDRQAQLVRFPILRVTYDF